MIITDLEEADKEKQARKMRRQKEGYGVDSDTDSDDQEMGGNRPKFHKGASAHELREILKNKRGNMAATNVLERMKESNHIFKKKSVF